MERRGRRALIASHVLDHLDVFVGAVEQWLDGQDAEHAAEGRRRRTQADRHRKELHTLDGRRERLLDDYEQLLADDDPAARLVLDRASKLGEERAALVEAIESAESVAAEWTTSTASTVSYYENVAAALRERLKRADGAQAMNATLASVLAGLWAEVEEDRERLLVEFELREPTEYLLAGTKPIFAQRPTLPPRHTGTFTFVFGPKQPARRSATRHRRRRSSSAVHRIRERRQRCCLPQMQERAVNRSCAGGRQRPLALASSRVEILEAPSSTVDL